MTDISLRSLTSIVQHNCNISDARHARDYTMCIYLLKMREFYRWEQGYGYADTLPRKLLGKWLADREAYWESIIDEDYTSLEIDGSTLSPFESDQINSHFAGSGLIYSGGLGVFSKPSFCIARLERYHTARGHPVYIAGEELARDINANVAVSDGHSIFIRRASLRQYLWEKREEWIWNRKNDIAAHAFSYYDFNRDIDQALDAMTENETDAVILHEIGELGSEAELGSAWREMLATNSRTRVELVARAVKDHLADAMVTLPELIARKNHASLHFYMANLHGMRRDIFPSLIDAYRRWQDGRSIHELAATVEATHPYWQQSAEKLLRAWQCSGENGNKLLENIAAGISI